GEFPSGHVLESMVLVFPMLEIDPGNAEAFHLGIGFFQGYETLAAGIRQRTEQHVVNDAENGSVRADAEGESQENGACKCRTAPHGAKAVTQVLQDAFKRRECPGVACALTRGRDIAEITERRD